MGEVSECLWVLLTHNSCFCSGQAAKRQLQSERQASPGLSARKHDYVMIYFFKKGSIWKIALLSFQSNMAPLLSGTVGALEMTDASVSQTGREIKCLPPRKMNRYQKKPNFNNNFIKQISLVLYKHFTKSYLESESFFKQSFLGGS